eukprot:scaffold15928_cov86-Isochrysis_galbana.AAC.2
MVSPRRYYDSFSPSVLRWFLPVGITMVSPRWYYDGFSPWVSRGFLPFSIVPRTRGVASAMTRPARVGASMSRAPPRVKSAVLDDAPGHNRRRLWQHPNLVQTPATEAVAGEGPCGAVSQSWTKRIAEVVA